MSHHNKRPLSRRTVLTGLGAAAVTLPFWTLSGCSSDSSDTTVTRTDSSNSGSTGSTGSTGTSSDLDLSYSWASGGTSALTANFPDDSLFDSASACALALTGTLTQGPCYFSVGSLDDISEGQEGLPMQLCLQVIDSDCNPVSGLEVEVWHCDVAGIYSGDTSDADDGGQQFNSAFCTDNDSEALQSKWFRGYQVTDSSGRVNFKSCFPGWYSSRTIHIHFKITSNGNQELVSQFCFPDALTANICTTQSDYASRGIQDTNLASGRDTVYGSDYDDYLFEWQQNEDGSLLAFKTIQIS
ncbi:MAG: intradiol ring-cleavage dioxygenase [Pseudomonadota bacterium]|uniref:dioxygenase family protein n=1 Tax=Gallaecimonas pentaromativorans TaxID=584787 RepID=UPI00067F3BCC|nr:intradiol ring-cleavage dioxygenase [Gallaecimonas pentaromativorans]MED5523268.1 intradiol ring-cleavage dioxygenase [Pseudomonadota bacterium]